MVAAAIARRRRIGDKIASRHAGRVLRRAWAGWVDTQAADQQASLKPQAEPATQELVTHVWLISGLTLQREVRAWEGAGPCY